MPACSGPLISPALPDSKATNAASYTTRWDTIAETRLLKIAAAFGTSRDDAVALAETPPASAPAPASATPVSQLDKHPLSRLPRPVFHKIAAINFGREVDQSARQQLAPFNSIEIFSVLNLWRRHHTGKCRRRARRGPQDALQSGRHRFLRTVHGDRVTGGGRKLTKLYVQSSCRT